MRREEVLAMSGDRQELRLLAHYADVEEIATETEAVLRDLATAEVRLLYAEEATERRDLRAEIVRLKAQEKILRVRAAASRRGATLLQTLVRSSG